MTSPNRPNSFHPLGVPRHVHVPENVASKFSKPSSKALHIISRQMLAEAGPHVVGNNHTLGKPLVQRTTQGGTIEKGVFVSSPHSDNLILDQGVRLQPDGLCLAGEFYAEHEENNPLDEGLVLQLESDKSNGWTHLSTGYHDPLLYMGVQMLQAGSKRTPQALLTGTFEWEDHRGHLLMCGHMLYPDGSGVDVVAGDPIRSYDNQFMKAVTELYPAATTLQAQRRAADKPLAHVQSAFAKDLEGMLSGLNKEFDSCILSQINNIRRAGNKKALLVAVISATEAIEPYLRTMLPPDLKTCQQYASLFNHLGSYACRGELFRS